MWQEFIRLSIIRIPVNELYIQAVLQLLIWSKMVLAFSYVAVLGIVAVSCGYDTCFSVRTCDGLYHVIFSIYRVGKPLHSEIDQIHLGIEAHCVTNLLPLGDCHRYDVKGTVLSGLSV